MEAANNQAYSNDDLKKVRLFKSVDLQAISELLQLCPVRELDSGERLICRGQPNDTIYLLLAGRLNVYLDDSEAGEPLVTLVGGETVGEMSVVDNQLASATVVAHTPCRLLVVEKDVLWSLLNNLPEVAFNLMNIMTQRLRHGNALLRRAQHRQRHFERHAVTDPLTSLFNRRWLEEMLPRQMQICAGSDQPFSLFIADIDFFKDFNDSYGHLAGDEAIKAVAESIRYSLRRSDMAVRFGGEEFLILLPGTDRDEALLVAERIRKAVADTSIFRSDGRPLPKVTVSIGLAVMLPEHSPQELIEVADLCLYRAKQNGRDSVVG